MNFLSRCFLLSDQHTPQGQIPNWQVSALRIILLSGFLLCFAIAFRVYSVAIEFQLFHAIIISFSFIAVMLLLLFSSVKYYTFSAHGLIVSILASGIFMNLFLTELNLAQIGTVYMYSCPIIAMMLLGFRMALFYSLINLIPFYVILNDIDLSGLTPVDMQLPNSKLFINEVVFLVFNICIPLALARAIVAAKRLNQSMLKSNTHLTDKNALYRTFFAHSNNAKIIVDNHAMITDFNRLAAKLFYLQESDKDTNVALYQFFPQLKKHTPDNSKTLITFKHSQFYVSSEPINDKNYVVYEFIDCTQEQNIKHSLVNMEKENKRLRYCDKHSQLPNRDWFEMQCERLLAKYQRKFYIVVVQTANSEYLNLKFSKREANTLLTSAYKRLKHKTEGPLLCAHIGPDKLAFLITANSQPELRDKQLNDIKATLDEEYNLHDSKCHQSFLFGFAKFSPNSESSSDVLSNAVGALKLANINAPFSGYNDSYSKQFLEKYEISMLLDEALQRAELDVVYQPKVTASGKCIGLEALARWNSPILGSVPPSKFIAIAEEYKLINRLTDLIIQKVCAQIAYWTQAGMKVLPVAINISLIDFSQTNFMSKLVKYLADFDVQPEQIELELTETSLEANQSHSLKLIQTLQSWGFTISVDDFGVGYSNISRLAEYPINKLKLDRSLISQVTHSSRQKSLVKSIHVMCKELDIMCVAEGVETQEQVSLMSAMGCTEFQGFYFSKPMSAKSLYNHVKQFGFRFNQQIPNSALVS